MKLAILILALVSCTADTATIEQDTCTSPPVAPPIAGARPTRGKAECMPAFSALRETQLAVYNESVALGITPDRWQITCSASYGVCYALYTTSGPFWYWEITCDAAGCETHSGPQ